MSGKHKSHRRKLSQSDKQWELQDEAAKAAGMSWADWARAQVKIVEVNFEYSEANPSEGDK